MQVLNNQCNECGYQFNKDYETKCPLCKAEFAKDNYDYQLKGGSLKVKVIDVLVWDVKAIRSDNGKMDIFPIQYFRENFKKISEPPAMMIGKNGRLVEKGEC